MKKVGESWPPAIPVYQAAHIRRKQRFWEKKWFWFWFGWWGPGIIAAPLLTAAYSVEMNIINHSNAWINVHRWSWANRACMILGLILVAIIAAKRISGSPRLYFAFVAGYSMAFVIFLGAMIFLCSN